jgi:hypothetical protein
VCHKPRPTPRRKNHILLLQWCVLTTIEGCVLEIGFIQGNICHVFQMGSYTDWVTPCRTIFQISTTEGTHCLDIESNGQINGAGLYISQTFVLLCMGPLAPLAMNNWSLLLSPRPIGHRLSIHLLEILFKVHSMKWMTPTRISVCSHFCEETEVVIHP